MIGVLNIFKDAGMTSAAAVAKARHILGEKSIGHMGTLDPQGTGVLLAGVGKATRLFDYFLKKDKVYEAEFTFGFSTDTLDGDGQITARTDVIPTKHAVLKALEGLTGALEQLPPAYSAKSNGGVRAYDLARKGIEPELKPARITVYAFTFLDETGNNSYRFRIHCSAGTYIRSLCRDLAGSVGSLATMTAIHRSRAGNFTDETAVTLAKLAELKERALVPLDTVLQDAPRRDFTDELYEKILNGIKIDTEPASEPFTVYCKNELFGLGKEENGKLKITAFLKE
jgi:tRNA pseudouridine55 synthase